MVHPDYRNEYWELSNKARELELLLSQSINNDYNYYDIMSRLTPIYHRIRILELNIPDKDIDEKL